MYQFIRIQVYARAVDSRKKSAWTARQIVDEASRIQGNCDHIENPQPPTLLFGVMPNMALDEAEKKVEVEKDEVRLQDGSIKFRKVRADKAILLAGVASYPREGEEYQVFRDLTLRFLKRKYGSNLKSVVEHLDEAHPHIHFYCVADKVSETKNLHEGYLAQTQARLRTFSNSIGVKTMPLLWISSWLLRLASMAASSSMRTRAYSIPSSWEIRDSSRASSDWVADLLDIIGLLNKHLLQQTLLVLFGGF